MRKTKKILSVICALAMILSMFSTFVVANAADGISITSEVSETTGEAGKTVTVTFKANGVTTPKVRMVEFHVAVDTSKFEIVTDENDEYITSTLTGALSNLVGTDLGYSFVAAKGAEFDGTIGTMTLRLKENLTGNVTMAVTGALLTDGNGDMYDQASTDAAKKITASDVVVAVPEVKPSVGITNTVVADKYAKDSTIVVTFKADGVTTPKVRMVEFHVAIDTNKFDIVPDENEEYITSALTGALSNLVGTDLGYSFVAAKGAEFDGTIGTMTLKLKDTLTDKVTLKASGALLTDGNGDMYDQASADAAKKMYIDDIVIDPAGSTPSTTYTVTVADAENGTVTVGKTSGLKEGDKVTITATPNKGYEVDTITVKDADNNTVTVADDNTFTMPAKNVTVRVTFKKKATPAKVYEYTATVTGPSSSETMDNKYEVKYTENAGYTDTKHDKFDVVVQMYGKNDDVAVGYMIFKNVSKDDTVTFYVSKTLKPVVNTVASVDDSSTTFGKVLAEAAK